MVKNPPAIQDTRVWSLSQEDPPEREMATHSSILAWEFHAPWTAAYQAPLSMGFSRQEYWSGVPLPSPTERAGLTYAQDHRQLVGTCCTAQGAQLSDDE